MTVDSGEIERCPAWCANRGRPCWSRRPTGATRPDAGRRGPSQAPGERQAAGPRGARTLRHLRRGEPRHPAGQGKDLILFDGFQVDLDAGQVVPEDQGGDLQFLAHGEGGPRLAAVGQAKLYTLSKAPSRRLDGLRGPLARAGGAPPRLRRPLPPLRRWPVVGDARPEGGRRAGRSSGRFRSDLDGSATRSTAPSPPTVPHQVTSASSSPAPSRTTRATSGPRGRGPWPGP